MTEPKDLKVCPNCEKLKPSKEVYIRIDPYAADVHNEEVYVEMCDECEYNSAQDI